MTAQHALPLADNEKALRHLERFEACLAKLGEPAARGTHWALYKDDCLNLLPALDRDSIPLTVTSPPYNIGKAYEEIRPLERYLSWCAEWIEELYRASAPDGSFWLNLGYMSVPGRATAMPIPYLLWDRVPFFLVQEIIWNYGAGVSAKNYFSPRNEKFLWYTKNNDLKYFDLDSVRDKNVKYPNQKKNGKLRCNPLGKNPTDVWQIPKVTSGYGRSSAERTAHPAQFPVAVIERIIRSCSRRGDVVLDPFAGSGSTIEAAIRQGRCGIGIEIRADYIQVAKSRMKAVEAQGQLL